MEWLLSSLISHYVIESNWYIQSTIQIIAY